MEKQFMRVYRKRSTFKGATDTDYWYTATRSDGSSVVCNFKCEVPLDSPAFEISNVKGTVKASERVVNNETYKNYTYYITSCDFSEIQGEDLPL